MRKNKTQEIDFTDSIITPLKKWVNIQLDLDENVIKYLTELSKKSNQSIDNIITHILTDLYSEHMEISQLSAKTLKTLSKKTNHMILLDQNMPFARIELINQTNENPADEKIIFSPPKNSSGNENKKYSPFYEYECSPAKTALLKHT